MSETILILWGEGGDEAAAALFITELRAVCTSVKLVGLGGAQSKGAFGLILVPDITLSQALPLAPFAPYVVLPFDGNRLRRFITDPRLQQFIDEAHAHGAVFIQSDHATESATLPALFGSDTPYQNRYYPPGEALYRFIQQLIQPQQDDPSRGEFM